MVLLILDWIIYLSSYSWSNFRIRFVKIAYFFGGFATYIEPHDSNDCLGYLCIYVGISWKPEATDVFDILSLLAGIDILDIFFAVAFDEYFSDNLLSKVGLFSLFSIPY